MGNCSQDERYLSVADQYGAALERLARGYEADPDQRSDLLQEMHLALWRSLSRFDGRCSMRTWVYRIAHNVAASHVLRRRASVRTLASLEELETLADGGDPEQWLSEHLVLARVVGMIRALKPPDSQVMLLYLEDVDAASIAEITGLSARAVATRIHRIKAILAKQFHDGGRNES